MQLSPIRFKANCQICKRPAQYKVSLRTGWHVYVCAEHIDGKNGKKVN